MTTAIDSRLKFQLLFWYGIIGVGALILGTFLASDLWTIIVLLGGMGWLVLLPYHGSIAFSISVAMFGSAVIIPFLPGRPFLWEFGTFLAWTGVVMNFGLRRYPADFGRMFHRHRWLLLGATGYVVTLLLIMWFRGMGLRVLGSHQVGGRFYMQQLLCSVFPLLCMMIRTDEAMVTRLMRIQYMLTATYLVSDMVFSFAPPRLWWILSFFEIPNDAVNFEMQNISRGLRRFQSFSFAGQGFIFLMLLYFNLRVYFTWRGLYLIPVTLVVFGVSLLSGHRWVFAMVVLTLFFSGIAQRFFNARNFLKTVFVSGVLLAAIYSIAPEMPLAFQRSVSFLPGIRVAGQAQHDAASTLGTRKALRQIGMKMIPEYFWLGRGFAHYLDDYSIQYDPTGLQFLINQGAFYNGFIGLMVNTGIGGTTAMFVFILAGSACSWRLMRNLRRHGCEDGFARVCSLMSSLWFANVAGFLFLHGDSEFAMRIFSMQAGLLIVCDNLLARRLVAESAPVVPAPAPSRRRTSPLEGLEPKPAAA